MSCILRSAQGSIANVYEAPLIEPGATFRFSCYQWKEPVQPGRQVGPARGLAVTHPAGKFAGTLASGFPAWTGHRDAGVQRVAGGAACVRAGGGRRVAGRRCARRPPGAAAEPLFCGPDAGASGRAEEGGGRGDGAGGRREAASVAPAASLPAARRHRLGPAPAARLLPPWPA